MVTFPAGSYSLVGTTGAQTISGKTFSSGTVFQGTTTLDIINNTSQTATGNITAGSFTGPLTGNVTGNVSGNAGTATTFTTALVGEVAGGNNGSNTLVSNLGAYPRATFLALLANVANATESNIIDRIVQRNASGDFAAGTITAALAGNAATATTLQTPRLIYGNAFNGSADVTGIIPGTFGGTGVNNVGKTITIGGGNFATAGTGTLTFTTTAATGVTLPTSGTLYGTQVGSISSANLTNSISDETGTGLAVFANSPSLVTPRATSIVGNSTTPASGPLGTGISAAAISGTNIAGTVTFTSAGTAGGGTDLITVTYSGPAFPTGSYPVLYPANAAAAALSGPSQVFATGNTTGFTITSGPTPPPGPAVQYIWNYHVIGN